MEKVVHYRAIITEIIAQEAQQQPRNGDIEVVTVCDSTHDHYQVLYLGWEQHRRVFAPVLHIRLRDGKIWIEHDGTEEGVANLLVQKHVPHDDIVLAFHAPWKRPYTDFAAA
jgi:hypothetical protein